MSPTGRRPVTQPALLDGARLAVGRVGRAELRLAGGARSSELRAVPWRGGLLVLAPRPNPLTPDLDDPRLEVAACARVFDATSPPARGADRPDDDGWLVAAFFGWLSRLPAGSLVDAATAFAARHPTGDLLGLGTGWDLLQVEVVEALVSGYGDIATLDGGAASALLVA